MKFLFLITHYYPHVYGAEVFAQKLAEHLVKQGHQVDVVTGKWQSSWKIKEKINGVTLYRVPVVKIRFLKTMLFIFPQLRKARSLMSSNSYDYIHAHIFPSLVTGSLLKSKAKKIVTIQGGDLGDYDEIYGPFKFIFKPLISLYLKSYDTIHTVSTDLRAQVKKLTNRSSKVIPNAIEFKLLTLKLNQSVVKKYSLPNTKYLAYSPSRLTDKNNLVRLIKVINQLNQQGIDIGLAIAGTGHLEIKLRNLIKELHLESKVALLGYVPQSDNHQLIKKADLMVRVSSQEGFGIAILEALALKTPVVSSLQGGLKDFISTKNAYLAQPNSITSITKATKALLSESKTTTIKANQGHLLAKNEYTYTHVLKRFTKEVYGI